MMQYAAFCEVINGDEYNMDFTIDINKAYKDAGYILAHLTKDERKNHVVSVRGWDVPDGLTFDEWTDEMWFIPGAVFYADVADNKMTDLDILKAMVDCDATCGHGLTFGLRSDNEIYNVGDELECSRVWDDGCATDDYLDGTCATGFGYIWRNESGIDIDDIYTVSKSREINAKYRKDHVYLIAGYRDKEGVDDYEIIIEKAFVVAIVK